MESSEKYDNGDLSLNALWSLQYLRRGTKGEGHTT